MGPRSQGLQEAADHRPDVDGQQSVLSGVPARAGAPDDEELARLAGTRVLPRRNPGRWIATLVVAVVVAQILHGLVTNPFYEWHKFGYWFTRPVLMDGLVITLKVTAMSAVLGFLGGVVLALGRLSKNPLLQVTSWTYIWLFRSIPLIVLLLFLFNLSAIYPSIGLGIPFGPIFVEARTIDALSYLAIAVLGLSLNEAAYAAEIVRAGILSVDQGQVEAAHSLGLSRGRLFRRIVLPQALRSIVPSYVNQLIGLIKASSLVYFVSLLDLFGSTQTMSSTYPTDIIPLYLVATAWYVILTSILSVIQFYVERYYSRGALRVLPPTPLQRLRTGVASLGARVRESYAQGRAPKGASA